jgi:hypothetical protein
MAVGTQPSGRGSASVGPWSDPEQMHEVASIVRLLTEIWAVPRVTKIGLATRDAGIDLWVFMSEDDYEAEGQISLAERDYLNASASHGFALHVVPGADVDTAMLPAMMVLLER